MSGVTLILFTNFTVFSYFVTCIYGNWCPAAKYYIINIILILFPLSLCTWSTPICYKCTCLPDSYNTIHSGLTITMLWLWPESMTFDIVRHRYENKKHKMLHKKGQSLSLSVQYLEKYQRQCIGNMDESHMRHCFLYEYQKENTTDLACHSIHHIDG